MKILLLIAASLLVPQPGHGEETKAANAWADTEPAVSTPAKTAGDSVKKQRKHKTRKLEASATTTTSSEGRAPASSPDANKVIPSPLQLPTAVATPTPSAPPVLPGTLKFTGFVDLRYSAFNAPNDPNVTNPHAESGFGVEDGAFGASYDQDQLSFTATLGFRRLKDSDQNLTGVPGNQSSNSRMNFAADGSSELYAKYKADEHWTFDLGQYFGILGSESGQSRGRSFSKPSLLSGLLPSVQTGFMTEYANKGWSAKLEAANPANRGTYGSSSKGDDATEYTAAFGYSNDVFQSQLGALTRRVGTADGLSNGSRTLVDLTLGLTLGAFSGSVEGLAVDDPSKNTLTPGTTDHEAPGAGVLGLLNYKISESNLLGLRYERLSKDPGAVSLDTSESYGLSVHHRLHQNVDLATEINLYNYQSVTGQSWQDSLFNIGAIVSF